MTVEVAPRTRALMHLRQARQRAGALVRRIEPRLVATLIAVIGVALTFAVTQLDLTEAENAALIELDLIAQIAVEDAHNHLDESTSYATQLAYALGIDHPDQTTYRTMLTNQPGVAWVQGSTPTAPPGTGPALTRPDPEIGSDPMAVIPIGDHRLLVTAATPDGPSVTFGLDLAGLLGSSFGNATSSEIDWTLQRNDSYRPSDQPVTHSEFLHIGDHTYRLDVTPAPGSNLASTVRPSLRLVAVGIAVTGWAAWAGAKLIRRRRDSEAEQVKRRIEAETRVGWASQILDQIDTAVIYTDLDGRVSYWNRHAETLYGWTAAEAVGQPIGELTVPANQQDVAADIVGTLLATGSWEGEFDVRRSDGTVFPARVADRLLIDSNGEPIGIVGVSVDITDERAARDGLTELVRSKDQFLATVSHELRTPLTAVVGFAELLQTADSIPEAEIAELHELIVLQAREVSDLVEDLLTAGRIESETITVRPEPVPITDLIRDVARPWIRTVDLTIEISDPDTLAVHADPLRLRQIVRNLIANTVRHGAPPVIVTVGAVDPAGCGAPQTVAIEVVDSGAGIAESSIDELFQPYSGAAVRHGHPTSVGLGLYVSRRLAQMMGGDLRYDRDTGRTRFTVTLPAAILSPCHPAVLGVVEAP